ncbi:putative dehydrogenase [Thermocatellispora tengchongensis]|uniref:Putative dehydrogenase n=1 Tax=Thermocatellispora tengchongensis TaxID=1073253 RepID=A0A840PB08_9ACTN|nr:DUF6807 family protein [Thermocatellispora tengchongensis]MBB5133175.1 putative dehydrogenase [Thermocatellispora tengchongensis]
MDRPARVVLAGAHGHGWWHLDNLRRLRAAGLAELVGVCDLRPVEPEKLRGLGEPPQSPDLTELIERTGAEITVLVTPIHTHAELAVRALAAGSHLLLEKPPASSAADFDRIAIAVARSGLACQVGFQSLGSAAVPAVRKLIADGAVGRVRGIGAAGAWPRPATYFTRSPWAGRRRIDGVETTDGALTNPFAHAVATALALADAPVEAYEIELYHANPIEADDTSSIRLRLSDGTVVTVAVSLCAPERHEPYVVVHGDAGRITLTYTMDEVRVGDGPPTRHPRVDLLENLIEHIRGGAELLVPLHRTAGFMGVLEEIRRAPDPLPIPDEFQELIREDGEVTRRVLPGIAELTARSAERLALFGELEDAPWSASGVALRAGGRTVARYVWRHPDVPVTVSPRPFLHPVRTLGGVEVSETRPADHVHHLGVCVAIADVGGRNFWGGRTWVPGEGPRWLDDHGVQRHVEFTRLAEDGLEELLSWTGPGGEEVLRERRAVRAVPLRDAWALDLRFTLANATGAPLEIRSSATKGRAGAAYGGFFWRAPGSATAREVFTAEAEGEEAVHGSATPWLALTGAAPDGREWTLVFVRPGPPERWFARVREYPGIGVALAWEHPLLLETELSRRVVTVVADGRLDRATAAAYAAEVTA